MLAIGASSLGDGMVASCSRACLNVSIQFTSGVRRVTCVRFQATPDRRTNRINALSSGLLVNAVTRALDSKPAMTTTKTKNTSMRMR